MQTGNSHEYNVHTQVHCGCHVRCFTSLEHTCEGQSQRRSACHRSDTQRVSMQGGRTHTHTISPSGPMHNTRDHYAHRDCTCRPNGWYVCKTSTVPFSPMTIKWQAHYDTRCLCRLWFSNHSRLPFSQGWEKSRKRLWGNDDELYLGLKNPRLQDGNYKWPSTILACIGRQI